jgi:uncharacterized protein YjbI with pentapeptide repeats
MKQKQFIMETRIIGNKIAETRKGINMSQAQLAERLFISPQAVGKWERGESMPDIITFGRLAEILGVDLNYFSAKGNSLSSDPSPAEVIVKSSEEIQSVRSEKKPAWDMSRGNWVDADFSGLKNLNGKFSSSNMLRCLFIGSDLAGIQLKSNNINSCNFSGSDFSGSHLQSSNLANNQFKDCVLKETVFSESYISEGDFTGADLTGVTIKSGGFAKCTLEDTILNRTSFIDTHLADLVFSSIMEDCCFENCTFTRVTFQNVSFKNTFFKNKSLKRIKFIDCTADRMTYAFLKNGKADLTGITLLTE